MRLLIPSLLTLFVLTACATAPAAKPATAPRIVVEPDERAGFWRATYELTEPVRELRFERTPFRSGVFEVLTEGFAMERDGDTDVLRTSGAPAQRIVVRFPELTRELEKEYDFFQKFTDGSVAIYTGHLAVRAGSDAADPACTNCAIRRFRFVPPRGQHVVVAGSVVNGPAEWTDTAGDGAYVYIGSIAPLESKELVAVVDPGLPRWLWEETQNTLPRLFDTYASRLGVSPRERPFILFNAVDRGAAGYSYGGGALPGQIQLTVDGAAWKERSEDAVLQLFHFLAHESAHLWNGGVIQYAGGGNEWMHEGSADALSERMLRDLGSYDEAAFYARQTESFNECRRKLTGFALSEAAKRNAFELYYSCGDSLALFTERSVASHDLFDFWRTLIARVRASGRTTFDTSDYYEAMAAAGATAEDVAQLRRFAEEAATADALAAMLRAKGVRLSEATPSQAWGQSVARDALLRLLAQHCKGPYGFTQVESGLSMTKTNSCGPLPGGWVVTAIGGHDVVHDGAATWDELSTRCGSEEPVRVDVALEGMTKAIEVPCAKRVAAVVPWLRIEAPAP